MPVGDEPGFATLPPSSPVVKKLAILVPVGALQFVLLEGEVWFGSQLGTRNGFRHITPTMLPPTLPPLGLKASAVADAETLLLVTPKAFAKNVGAVCCTFTVMRLFVGEKSEL